MRKTIFYYAVIFLSAVNFFLFNYYLLMLILGKAILPNGWTHIDLKLVAFIWIFPLLPIYLAKMIQSEHEAFQETLREHAITYIGFGVAFSGSLTMLALFFGEVLFLLK